MRARLMPAVMLCLVGSGARAGEPAAPAQRLMAATFGPTPAFADMRELVDTVGGRPTGSAALERAVEWSLGTLRAAGLDEVHTEGYVAPRVWLARTESAEVTAPVLPGATLRAVGLPFAAGTPAGRTGRGAAPHVQPAGPALVPPQHEPGCFLVPAPLPADRTRRRPAAVAPDRIGLGGQGQGHVGGGHAGAGQLQERGGCAARPRPTRS